MSSSEAHLAKPQEIKERFYFLDALRGIAALSVVLFHLEGNKAFNPLMEVVPSWILKSLPVAGVAIFLVLSGFVIAYSLRKSTMTGHSFKNFMIRRTVRLTPPYYLAILVAIGFSVLDFLVRKDPIALPTISGLIANLFYIQDLVGVPQIIQVAWTLCIEMQFYLIFCLLLLASQYLNKRYQLKNSLLMMFMPVGLLALFFLPIPDYLRSRTFPTPICFIPLWYSFFLGVLVCWVWLNQIKSRWLYLYMALALFVGILPVSEAAGSKDFAIAAVLSALLILLACQQNGLSTWLNWRWLQFLGLISYSLYLTHSPMLSASSYIWLKMTHEPSAVKAFIGIFFVLFFCILLAFLVWRLIEKPAMFWSSRVRRN